MTRTAVALLFLSVALVYSLDYPEEPRLNSMLRRRPSSRATAAGLTDAEKKEILDCHNDYRRSEGASDMELMAWDDQLASMAADWAAACVFEHGQPAGAPISGPVGQNILFTTESKFSKVCKKHITKWYNEKSDYDFDSQSCNGVCGHYTQIVWATTNKVGCAVAKCSPLEKSYVDGASWFLVCNYMTPGNWMGEDPYSKGAACADCVGGSGSCDNGLCTSHAQSRSYV